MTSGPSQRVHYLSGASGTGTSTRAMQLQREWSAPPGARPTLVIATDVVRAQLRTVLEEATCPELFGESFNLPARDGERLVDGVAIDAFLAQCRPILRAVEAGVTYALGEGWNVVVEGVHLVPGELQVAPASDAQVTFELLVVEDRAEHVARLRSRDAASDGRRGAAHYERNLDRIHVVQRELRTRLADWRVSADAADVTVVGG